MSRLAWLLGPRLVAALGRTLAVIGCLAGLAIAVLGVQVLTKRANLAPLKTAIAAKTPPGHLAKAEKENLPMGMDSLNEFQARLAKLAAGDHCVIDHFRASDTIGRYVSAYSGTGPADASLGQIEVKLELKGTTGAVVQTLADMHDLGIPYEFTSMDLTRTSASPKGIAAVRADISLRILTKAEAV